MKRLFIYTYFFNSAFSLLTYLHSEHILFFTETLTKDPENCLNSNLQHNLKIIYSLKNYICQAKLNLVLEENGLVNVTQQGMICCYSSITRHIDHLLAI